VYRAELELFVNKLAKNSGRSSQKNQKLCLTNWILSWLIMGWSAQARIQRAQITFLKAKFVFFVLF
jgi:hypothetical protein